MSLYKDASLVMIPSAYKDGKLYSIRPTDGSGDFTFSRGSNLAATRVDVNGLIEKGRENLLLRSNEFDNAYWTKTDSSIVTGQADPNGGSNAFKIVENTNTAYHRISGNYTMVFGNVYATSVTAKAAGRNHLTLSNNVGAGTCIFNLTDGSISLQEPSVISASATSLGGGWYRCEMVSVGDKNGIYNVFIGCDDDGVIAPYTGDGTSGVLIYQSQLELGLVASDYIETGASTAQAGILENMPRLDYSGGASCPSLLLEPSRSNLLPQSEYTGSWLTPNSTLTQNDVISPEGVQNATKFEFTASGSGSTYALRPNASQLTFTNDYLFSVFIKKGNTRYVTLAADFFTTSMNIGFDLDEGTAESGGVIESYANDWYRLSITNNVTGDADRTGAFYIYLPDSLGTENSVSGNYAYVYGADIQEGSYPTSYIPTYGTSQTRSQDVCNSSENSVLFNKTEGVLFLESSALAEGTDRRISISDGTTNNYISIGYSRFTGNIIAEVFYNGVSQQPNWGATGVTQTDNNKFALSWGSGTMKFYVNGVLKLTDSVTSPVGLDILRFSAGNSSLRFIGETKQVIVFPTALTDSECIALTTL